MRIAFATILAAAFIMYHVMRGKKGMVRMAEITTDLTSTTTGKVFFIAGIVSAILLAFMLLTGQTSFREIIEMERKMVESCPFCM